MSERRELILQLGQMITDRIGHKVTTEDPEYWGLACIVTDEMAEVALKMKVRKPMTFEQMLKATGKEEKKLQELLDEMSRVGLIEYNWENPKREKQYVLPMFVPGSAEFTNMNKQQLEEHPELGRFFERMSRLPLEKVTPMVPPGGAGIGMHVIPVEKAIEMENQSIDIEHISHWLKKYDGKYAASPCSCRMSRQTYDEGCADDPEDWCIAVGDMADYVVETNKGGRYITYDEVMEILKRAEDNGFMHQITNIDGENKIFAICNCNVNVCYALRTSQLFNTPNMSRSAYVARVETQDCVACGRCVEYCPAGAVKLGQKLCTKDGPVSYPKHELPDGAKGQGRAGADQKGEPIPRSLRACVQPPMRRCMYPGNGGPGSGHRRSEEVYRPAGSGSREPVYSANRSSYDRTAVRREDRDHRRRPGRTKLRILFGGEGISSGGIREE